MDLNNLLQLADVALLRGDRNSSYNPSPLTSPTPSVATERLPAYQLLRHFPSMPLINTIPQQNAHSPPPLNRAPAPTTSVRPPQASTDTRRQQTPDQSPADFFKKSLQYWSVLDLESTDLPLHNLLSRRIRRRRSRRRLHSHYPSASRVVIQSPHFRLLMKQAPSEFGLRFLRLASAPERTRARRRSLQLPRRLHFPLGNQNGITTTATFYLSRRIAHATPSRRASASARSSKRQRNFLKCAVAPATDGLVSSSPDSAPMRPRKFVVLISSTTTSTTTPFAKVCLHYSVA